MKKILMTVLFCAVTVSSFSQEKEQIVKTGLNVGPLPAVAYDADKGFQLGAVIQLFDYGDGHNYPNYDSKLYMEASFFTKGSQLYQLRYDNKELIPGIRWCSAARLNIDKAYDFYGFNGYESNYSYTSVDMGKQGKSYLFSPFYRIARTEFLFKSEFIGDITRNFKWEAGIFANYHKIGTINYDSINKGKSDTEKFPEGKLTLYDYYKGLGAISESEANGGFSGGIRLGLTYDSRDKEGAPSRGIWAEGHVAMAPKFLAKNPYYRYSLTFRHYLPIVKNDKLTFAYRLNYEGTLGKTAPFYVLPYMTVMGERSDNEGMGGFFTVRGIMRSRVIGLDTATYNMELRWRFVNFSLWNQNIALGLSAFSDGTMVTRDRDISALNVVRPHMASYDPLNPELLTSEKKDHLHITFGAGFRFIMNENFIVAFEYGTPLTHFQKNSPLYNQDGTGAFYVNIGYLF